MSVVVVLPDADQRDARPNRRVQRRVLLGRAVMGDLDDVHRGHAFHGGHQGALGIGLQVTQRQHGDPADLRVHDEAGVVDPVVGAVAGRAAAGLRGWWPEDAPRQSGRPTVRPGGGGRHRGARGPHRRLGGPDALNRPPARAGQDGWTSAVAERAREAVDVVGVEVREDDEVQLRHVPATQAAVDAGRIRARVDQHGSFGSAAQQHRVALADVALDDTPALRRATADEEAWRDQPAQDHRQHDQSQGPREPASGARSPSEGREPARLGWHQAVPPVAGASAARREAADGVDIGPGGLTRDGGRCDVVPGGRWRTCCRRPGAAVPLGAA
jgi:hypothetical protein